MMSEGEQETPMVQEDRADPHRHLFILYLITLGVSAGAYFAL